MKLINNYAHINLVLVKGVPYQAFMDSYEARHAAQTIEHETGEPCLVVEAEVSWQMPVGETESGQGGGQEASQ